MLTIDCALIDKVHVASSYYLAQKPQRLLEAAKHYGVEAAPAAAKVTTKAARGSKKAAATEESAQA